MSDRRGSQQPATPVTSDSMSPAESDRPARQRPRTGNQATVTELVIRHPSVQRRRRRMVRRLAAFLVLFDAGASVLNIALGDRVHLIAVASDVLPISVPQASAVLGLGTSMMLVGLARGLRRGQRPAMLATVSLLAIAALLRIPVGPPQAAALPLAAAVTLWLLRDHFHSQVDAGVAWRRTSALLLLTLGIAIGAVAFAEGWALAHHRGVLSAGDVFGLHWSELHKPERVLIFITALGVSAVLGYVLTTPRLRPLREGDSDVRAHAVVSAYSDDSLSYFALRDDKQHFATDDGLVAYRLVGGVCLVSPDPIGANPQTVWREFRNFAEHNGWPVAVVAANEQWAQTYGAEGCITIYMGDEAVVDVNSFSLEGRENRGLRQAVNRMKRYGYTVEMTTVGSIGAETRRMLRDISVENRLGAAERGFAMALGRIASTRDPELLLAICRNPEGEICGFCQLVPAPGIDGWSLDVMRRDRGEHPNGMVDFLVTEAIEYVRDKGQSHVSLNFATLRSFVQGDDLAIRGLRGAILRFLVRNAPMDTLYRFNAKFQPTWVPRFLCMDGTEYLVPVIFAIVEAEGLFEVPILGRLLVKTPKTSK